MTTTTATAAPPGQPGQTGKRANGPARPDEPGALAGIEAAARTLGLPTIRERFGDMLAGAQREHASYAGFLAEVLFAECDERDDRRQVRRVRDGAFPRTKRVEDFDFDANPPSTRPPSPPWPPAGGSAPGPRYA